MTVAQAIAKLRTDFNKILSLGGIPGDTGPPGSKGEPGIPGTDGTNGTNGTNGSPGADGHTPVKGVDYFDGTNGTNGTNGADGLTISVNSVTQVAGNVSLTQDNIPDGTTNKVYTATEKSKLSGIAENANNYTHPANHAPSIITQDASNRFVTDMEKSTWNGKQDALGFTAVPTTRTVNSKALSENITLTQDDVGDGTTNKAYTATEKTKLAGIETGATADMTASEIRTALGVSTLSGSNTGDQELSGYALKTNVLALDNTNPFTPDANYEPATKKYVDDSVSSAGGGDMSKSTYDTDNDGKVDSAEIADSVSWDGVTNKPTLETPTGAQTKANAAQAAAEAASTPIAHATNTSNPHSVTAAQIDAVSKTGDNTMTGILTLQYDSPQLNLVDTGNSNKSWKIINIDGYVIFYEDSYANLRYVFRTDGMTINSHEVYHAGNITPIMGLGTALPATTGTMTATMDGSYKTITPTGACTFNATGGTAGQLCTFVITTTGSTSRTLTFGTNFKTIGALATGATSGKTFTISFRYDGTKWCEVFRTTAM